MLARHSPLAPCCPHVSFGCFGIGDSPVPGVLPTTLLPPELLVRGNIKPILFWALAGRGRGRRGQTIEVVQFLKVYKFTTIAN